jgi:hypothetical protein
MQGDIQKENFEDVINCGPLHGICHQITTKKEHELFSKNIYIRSIQMIVSGTRCTDKFNDKRECV